MWQLFQLDVFKYDTKSSRHETEVGELIRLDRSKYTRERVHQVLRVSLLRAMSGANAWCAAKLEFIVLARNEKERSRI